MAKFQRITENTFKLMQEVGQVSHEDVVAAWEDDKNGEYVCILPDENRAYYVAHQKVMEEIPVRYGNIWAGVRVWMDSKGFYPNIWSANERGNLELWDKSGRNLGGLV